MDDPPELQSRWKTLWARLGVSPQRAPAIDRLLQAYRSTGRHYHTLRHIQMCLNELDAMRAHCAAPDAVELAIWYHDAVYDPTRSDNESRSAAMATEAMRAAGLSPTLIQHVGDLILQTQHAAPPTDFDAQTLIDIDLSILGQSPETFAAYEHAIRKEYAHVDELAFRVSRAKILQAFLERPTIYTTPPMREKYETAARANLQRSIEKLTQ